MLLIYALFERALHYNFGLLRKLEVEIARNMRRSEAASMAYKYHSALSDFFHRNSIEFRLPWRSKNHAIQIKYRSFGFCFVRKMNWFSIMLCELPFIAGMVNRKENINYRIPLITVFLFSCEYISNRSVLMKSYEIMRNEFFSCPKKEEKKHIVYGWNICIATVWFE